MGFRPSGDLWTPRPSTRLYRLPWRWPLRSHILGGKHGGVEWIMYSYVIVPIGGHQGQAIEQGVLANDLATAKYLAPNVNSPNAVGKSRLEVIVVTGEDNQEV